MAAARGDKFIEILANVLRRLILESIFLREQFWNAIIVEKGGICKVSLPSANLDIPAFALCFDSWLEVSDSIISVASPLNALMRDQISNLTAWNYHLQ